MKGKVGVLESSPAFNNFPFPLHPQRSLPAWRCEELDGAASFGWVWLHPGTQQKQNRVLQSSNSHCKSIQSPKSRVVHVLDDQTRQSPLCQLQEAERRAHTGIWGDLSVGLVACCGWRLLWRDWEPRGVNWDCSWAKSQESRLWRESKILSKVQEGNQPKWTPKQDQGNAGTRAGSFLTSGFIQPGNHSEVSLAAKTHQTALSTP